MIRSAGVLLALEPKIALATQRETTPPAETPLIRGDGLGEKASVKREGAVAGFFSARSRFLRRFGSCDCVCCSKTHDSESTISPENFELGLGFLGFLLDWPTLGHVVADVRIAARLPTGEHTGIQRDISVRPL